MSHPRQPPRRSGVSPEELNAHTVSHVCPQRAARHGRRRVQRLDCTLEEV
jgi:hypothetical protein